MGFHRGPKIVTDGLVLYVDAANPKSYVSGNTITRSLVGSVTGSLVNGVGFSTGSNGSWVFDGNNDYIDFGRNMFQYQTNFTIEAVATFPELPNNGAACGARHPIVYNHDYGYNLLVDSNGKVRWTIYNTVSTQINISSSNSVIGSNKFHAVGVKNGTLCTLYVNGEFQSSDNLTTNAVYYNTAHPFTVGGLAFCGSKNFYSTGTINKVQVYNRALSAAEVLQNYNATKSRFNL